MWMVSIGFLFLKPMYMNWEGCEMSGRNPYKNDPHVTPISDKEQTTSKVKVHDLEVNGTLISLCNRSGRIVSFVHRI